MGRHKTKVMNAEEQEIEDYHNNKHADTFRKKFTKIYCKNDHGFPFHLFESYDRKEA